MTNNQQAREAVNPNADMTGVNKDFLYGKFEEGEDRNRKRIETRDKLYMKAAHKALDIAPDEEDEMGVQANRTTNVNNNGLDWKGLAVVAALMAGTGLGGAGIVSMLANKNQPTPTPIEKPKEDNPDFKDSDTLFDLEFADPKPVK